jgi:hypothetical protein
MHQWHLTLIYQVADPSIPKVSELGNWQDLTWTIVLVMAPIGALNSAEAGFIAWAVGLAAYLYYCAYYL